VIDELVLQFERLVLPIDEGMPTDASIARKCLQAIIDPQFEREGRTLSDSLEAAEQSAPEHRRRAALLMLRALGGTNILANQDHGTGYERRVVTLISHGTPDIIKYFQVEDKKQTFERFVTIEQVHTQLLKKLTALPSISSHPETFLNARQDVLKALNQEIVKSYFSLYDIRHIQQAANTIFSQLSAIVATKTHEFPILLTRARALVEAEIEWAVKNSTFLSVDHYSPFLIAALDVCCALDTEARGRFSAHNRAPR
jgi:signal transduction histidine kinase